MTTKTQRRRWRMFQREFRRGPWLLSGILLTVVMIALALALSGLFS